MTTLAGRMMLQRSPLFRGLAPATLERVAALATQRRYDAGEVICSQGDPGDALLAVVTGKVRISTGAADGREIFLNIMEPGDTFGEIALLDGGTRTATAIAATGCELVSLRRDHLFELLAREPQVALELLRLCGERLLSLAYLHGEQDKGRLTLRISQEDLAGFLGITRQAVNQQLQAWKAKGWIALGRGSVTVLDERSLRAVAQGG
jgi:CRP-like cAMP-binding protein